MPAEPGDRTLDGAGHPARPVDVEDLGVFPLQRGARSVSNRGRRALGREANASPCRAPARGEGTVCARDCLNRVILGSVQLRVCSLRGRRAGGRRPTRVVGAARGFVLNPCALQQLSSAYAHCPDLDILISLF